jgi:hypothetical protein
MGRPPKPDTTRARLETFATLLRRALSDGHRAVGPYQGATGRPWTVKEFAHRAHASPGAVSSWFADKNPSLPMNVQPILRALYGDIPEFADAKDAMHRAWFEAGGNVDIVPEEPSFIDKTMIQAASPVSLIVTPPNDSEPDATTLHLLVTLAFRRFEYGEIEILCKGRPIQATFHLALKEAWLSVSSDQWQPTAESLFLKPAPYHNNVPDRFGNAIRIVPDAGQTYLAGELLSDVAWFPFQRVAGGVTSKVTITVQARKQAFDLTLDQEPPTDLNQKDVIDAIIRTATDTDKEGRIIVARKTTPEQD